MSKKLALNLIFNFFTAVIFVAFNFWALNQGLEETFVFIAITYGFIATVGNALFFRRS